MAISDTIADLLTRIRNASRARHRYVDVKASKLKLALVKILKETGFVEGYLVKDIEKAGPLRIYLKYKPDRSPLISDLLRVSKPSLRRYVKHDAIPRVRNGMGISVVSTSQGVLEGEEARKRKVGGELLCKVW
jgi:small subunit ribosomal protein S8